jgi:hypothetical protein
MLCRERIKMKNLIMGGIGVLSSILLFGMVLIPEAVYSLDLPERGYDRNLVVFGTALLNIETIPLLIGGTIFFIGIYYVIKGIKVIFFS